MNCAARVVFKARKREHITPYLQELHWLPIEERIECVYKTAPSYLNDLVSIYKPTRSLRSGDANLLEIPKHRNKYGSRAFSCVAPRIWNDLPIDIRRIESVSCFRKRIKTHLFKRVYQC